MNWDEYFLKIAKLVATKSKDPSTKIGAVIVGPDHEIRSTGYNDFPRRVLEDIGRRDRPKKYLYVEHAERNAIYNAARCGIVTKGCTLYMSVMPPPCADCARACIQAGIMKIVCTDEVWDKSKTNWDDSLNAAWEMLDEAKIEVTTVSES